MNFEKQMKDIPAEHQEVQKTGEDYYCPVKPEMEGDAHKFSPPESRAITSEKKEKPQWDEDN